MSLLQTKPNWCATVAATNLGWVNSVTNELLVSHRNLKDKLATEMAAMTLAKPQPVKKKVVKEAVVKRPAAAQQIIAEVVEYNVDTNIVGE